VSFAAGLDHGGHFFDTHAPVLLTRGLYHADGQQQDEVYDHGSFLQSRMYANGVTCADCHDPHSGKLRATGNTMCAQCHAPAKFDVPAHTLHPAGSAGAACAACHMPVKQYMVIDGRHDHSIRIPRPDLSDRLGTPNACNGCHADRNAHWAAQEIERAFGPVRKGFQTFADALHSARTGEPGARDKLAALIGDVSVPPIARATALDELQNYPGSTTLAALERGLSDHDPMLRGAALDALLTAEPQTRARLAAPLLDDGVRVVRIKAARAIAAVPLDGLSEAERKRRESAFAEYVASQQDNAERPESHLNLGLFYSDRGDAESAEAAYRAALRLQPDFAPAWVNLADLYRALGREPDAERTLRDGLKQLPHDGNLLHTLGLLMVRQGNREEALRLLGQAATASPDNPRYAYVFGVALHDSGKRQQALAVLNQALARFPNDRDLAEAVRAFSPPSR
jgi:predicted CXXCH cytochrome family protein